MANADGTEPVEDEERLYRRVPIHPQYFDHAVDAHPTPFAFRPRQEDSTGLSVYRAKYKSMNEVAANSRGKRYFIAVMVVGALRARGIEVEPRPLPQDPGHAEIPGLRYDNRSTQQAEEWQVALATALSTVEGPFPDH